MHDSFLVTRFRSVALPFKLQVRFIQVTPNLKKRNFVIEIRSIYTVRWKYEETHLISLSQIVTEFDNIRSKLYRWQKNL